MTQRGFPYPGWPLYHATADVSSVLRHGLLTRAELARRAGGAERHVTGGGTAHAISMTLDPRVAEAIVIGIKVISRIVKGEILLGDLLIAGSKQAPTGTADVIAGYKLTPERVERYDAGLRAWYTGGLRVDTPVGELPDDVEIASGLDDERAQRYGDEVKEVPDGAQEVVAFVGERTADLHKTPPERTPFFMSGWAPWDEVEKVRRYPNSEAHNNGYLVDIYKRMLAMSSYDAKEVYDPLFFLTDLDAMRSIDEEELCIVRARCAAKWLCATNYDAKRLGVAVEEYWVGADWYYGCETRLNDIAAGREHAGKASAGDRGWDQPDPSDTVVYKGAAMAEVRVYDSALLTDLYEYASLREIEDSIDPDFDEPGHLVIARPWFQARGN